MTDKTEGSIINVTMDKEIERFLAEDIGYGDITTNSIVPEDEAAEARIIAKDDAVIAGHAVVKSVFRMLDPHFSYEEITGEGAIARKGDVVSKISAKTRAILTGERVALNLFQRLSGIATATKVFVDAVEGTGVKILDTRKTSPGLRAFEKYAVRLGGGVNHRFDLSEMALVKENHIAIAGSIREAVRKIRAASTVAIEVEVQNMDELQQAIAEKVDRIMLDNWQTSDIGEAVAFVNRRAPIEVSGNMTPERAREVSRLGIDFISVGSITHSFKSADLSLLIV